MHTAAIRNDGRGACVEVEYGSAVSVHQLHALVLGCLRGIRNRIKEQGWEAAEIQRRYQPRLDRGELEHKVIFIKRSRGDFEPRTQVRVTTKGLFLLRAEMRERDRKRRIKDGEFDF